MKIVNQIRNSGKTLFSFEILPPLKGGNIENIYRTIDELLPFSPSFINITYHREELVYKKHKSGLLERKTVHKRPGTVAISAAIKYKYSEIEVIPHIICGGFSKEETENALIDLHFLGIHNILVLRGDLPKGLERFVPEQDGHVFAIDLVRQIMDLNNGIYLDDELQNTTKMDFSVGIAGYPEKHIEAPNLAYDMLFLKQKIEAGAEYIVTQMFFDNEKYFRFVDECRKNGIQVPIIPGLKPISTLSHLTLLPRTFHIDIPEKLTEKILKCSTNDDVRKVGIEWAIEQAKELIALGAPVIHFFTMGKTDNIQQIAKEIF